ncbi:hypothetical protein FHS16_003952 [Paenibacillus endophyticus]|uniref:SnoaL-like domain-containing protein n=1 Tax=Paenibacillus endophyticus TaxID=1294268 RepID=A0A7W5CA83_9BACL|nr:nuclear transport factor 2 family protein [Paenibacillus endophyticus]MBB3153877.1 hypothetical protein [Paenibacillus endophyticus]
MTQVGLPSVVIDYLEASNRHDVEGYARTFSNDGRIEEDSLGRELVGTKEIIDYFKTYFIGTNTHTDIIEYTVIDEVVDMRVWFKGDFVGKKIIGLYKFFLNNGRIEKLKCDLE